MVCRHEPECVSVVQLVLELPEKLEAAVLIVLNGAPGESGVLVLLPVVLELKQETECAVDKGVLEIALRLETVLMFHCVLRHHLSNGALGVAGHRAQAGAVMQALEEEQEVVY